MTTTETAFPEHVARPGRSGGRLPVSNGYEVSPDHRTVGVYCGRCGVVCAADAAWAARFLKARAHDGDFNNSTNQWEPGLADRRLAGIVRDFAVAGLFG